MNLFMEVPQCFSSHFVLRQFALLFFTSTSLKGTMDIVLKPDEQAEPVVSPLGQAYLLAACSINLFEIKLNCFSNS